MNIVRKRLLRADAVLGDASRILSFTLVNPENADSVRRKFLRKPFEPEFTYPELPNTDVIREKLLNLKLRYGIYDELLRGERAYLLAKMDMLNAIGTKNFGNESKKVYGFPDAKLVKKAEEFLSLPKSKNHKKILRKEVLSILRQAFNKLGFSYSIVSGSGVSSAGLSPVHGRLRLKSKERFSRDYVYRLAVHEIATHALRAENGRKQKLGIFVRGTPNYLATEEGLAAYHEELAGVMDTSVLKKYAGRVLAINYASKHTFVETFKYLKKYFDKDEAFRLTLRAKRGTNGVGACTKDHLYLKGYLEIKNYVASGGKLDLLYAGKIGLQDVNLLSKKLKNPHYIPHPVIEWVRQKRMVEQ